MTDLTQYIGNFDATEIPPDEYELINPGQYVAVITGTEVKDNGDKVGLIITLQIAGSQYDGRIISDYLNLKNPSDKAVKISNRRLADYALSIGVNVLSNSSVLHGKRVSIEVETQQPKEGDTYIDKYGVTQPSKPQNRIKKVSALNGAAPTSKMVSQQQEVAPQESVTETSSGVPPWAKK